MILFVTTRLSPVLYRTIPLAASISAPLVLVKPVVISGLSPFSKNPLIVTFDACTSINAPSSVL